MMMMMLDDHNTNTTKDESDDALREGRRWPSSSSSSSSSTTTTGASLYRGKGDRFECVWTIGVGIRIGTTKKNTTARVLLESLSLSLDACPKLESSTTTLRVVGAKKYGSLSPSNEKRAFEMYVHGRKADLRHSFCVCQGGVASPLKNLPKKSVCVFRRRHSPTEEEEEEKKKKKKNEETRDERERRRRSDGGKRRLRGERERL